MAYAVKEIRYTLQGEGAQAGMPAVLLRFAGCNLWTGHEQHRQTAKCRFCDTDFVGVDGPGGGRYADPNSLASAVQRLVPDTSDRPIVVCTGGEPLLQLDPELIRVLHDVGFRIAVETNGTLAAPADLDWICVSPKADAPLRQRSGDELKLVFPQAQLDPASLVELDFRHFFLQPLDGPDVEAHTVQAVEYCLRNPRWRLSLQTHKILGIP